MLRSFLPSIPTAYRPYSRFFDRGLFFAPDDPPAPAPATPAAQPAADPNATLAAALQRINERGDGGAALVLLERQATRIKELEAALPPSGAVVLSGDDAARWSALSGYKPDELKQQLERLTTLEQQLAEATRVETLRTAATVAKLNADALVALPNLPPVEVVGEGESRKAEVVKDGTRTPLDEYLKANYTALLPALQAQQSQGNQQQLGPAYPAQDARQRKPVSAAQAYIQQTYKPRPAPKE